MLRAHRARAVKSAKAADVSSIQKVYRRLRREVAKRDVITYGSKFGEASRRVNGASDHVNTDIRTDSYSGPEWLTSLLASSRFSS
jgi:hypothetical protein